MIQLLKRKEHFDVFISYRDIESKHSSSLARDIAQEFKERGYKVYFDAWYDIKWKDAIPVSDNYVVLLTDYSFEVKNEKSEEGKHFREEVTAILDRLKNRTKENPEWKGNALWLDVDLGYSSYLQKMEEKKEKKSDLDKRIENEVKYVPFMTHNKKNLINENLGEKNFFKKFPLIKRSTWVRLGKWSLLLAIALVCCGVRLAQYSRPGILFAGGGSPAHYLLAKMGVDVKNYALNSRYIHLPSSRSYDLLWDAIHEDESAAYFPVVLSTGEIDISKVNDSTISRFKNNSMRILEYKLGEVPLLVQLRNHNYSKKTITKEELATLLSNPAVKCYTTSSGSGTLREYTKILSDSFALNDSNSVFDPKYYYGYIDSPQIYLANEEYAIEDTSVISLKIMNSANDTAKVGLFLYTIGKWDSAAQKYKLDPPVKKFIDKLEKLGLSIKTSQYQKSSKQVVLKMY